MIARRRRPARTAATTCLRFVALSADMLASGVVTRQQRSERDRAAQVTFRQDNHLHQVADASDPFLRLLVYDQQNTIAARGIT